MKNLFLCLSVSFMALLSTGLFADGNEIKDPVTGVSFPAEISFDHNGTKYNLGATGVATRKKFFVKVYSVASYLQDFKAGQNVNVAAEIMKDGKAKQLTIQWVHEAPFGKIQEGYLESFQSSLGSAAFNAIQNEINTFVQLFNTDVKVDDEHVLRWIPGGDVEVLINGKAVGHITNVDFAKGLWSIWFGSHSVVDKSKLL
jgi:hypothetical protein